LVKWAGITFAIGMLLVVIEIWHASRKKGGITPTDKQRIMGIFWISCVITGLVAFLIWIAP
jgi:hypothetical protein